MQPSVQTPDLSSVGVGSRGRPERGRDAHGHGYGTRWPVRRCSAWQSSRPPYLQVTRKWAFWRPIDITYLGTKDPAARAGRTSANQRTEWHGKAVHGHSSWSFRLSKTSIAILQEATYPRPSKACIVALLHLRASRTGVLLVASQPVSGQFRLPFAAATIGCLLLATYGVLVGAAVAAVCKMALSPSRSCGACGFDGL